MSMPSSDTEASIMCRVTGEVVDDFLVALVIGDGVNNP